MAKHKFCVEFDGGFCFVEAEDGELAKKRARQEFGEGRAPYRTTVAKKEDWERFVAGNGEILEG
ncbi:MAG: hypothetical protein ABFE07_29045 [Armatimonadia bacterium]